MRRLIDKIRYILIFLIFSYGSTQLIPVPTILDTDIGTDYDDQLALTYILSKPSVFDLKLIICSTYNTTARAQIVAKTLAMFSRFDVAIGIGRNTGMDSIFEYQWAENYTLNDFQNDGGIVYRDGEQALLSEMQKANSNNIYYLVEISPATSLGHVLPQVSQESLKYIKLFAMAGSIYRGYGNTSQPSKEYNVVQDISAAKLMFAAPWASFFLAPVDSTNFMQFYGDEWSNFLEFRTQNIHVSSVVDSYTMWYNNGGKHNGAMKPFSPTSGTSTMFDVLAAFLAVDYPDEFGMQIDPLLLIVNDDGYTQVNSTHGKLVYTCVDFLTSDPYVMVELIGEDVLKSIVV